MRPTRQLSITWGSPSDIQYGTPLGVDQLNAVFTNAETGEAVTGSTTYTPASNAILNASEGQSLTRALYTKRRTGVEVKVC